MRTQATYCIHNPSDKWLPTSTLSFLELIKWRGVARHGRYIVAFVLWDRKPLTESFPSLTQEMPKVHIGHDMTLFNPSLRRNVIVLYSRAFAGVVSGALFELAGTVNQGIIMFISSPLLRAKKLALSDMVKSAAVVHFVFIDPCCSIHIVLTGMLWVSLGLL